MSALPAPSRPDQPILNCWDDGCGSKNGSKNGKKNGSKNGNKNGSKYGSRNACPLL